MCKVHERSLCFHNLNYTRHHKLVFQLKKNELHMLAAFHLLNLIPGTWVNLFPYLFWKICY